MSGGHWDYDNQWRLQDILERIGQDYEMLRRFPKLAAFLRVLGKQLPEITHDLDWDFSGDHSIEDDARFEQDALLKLRNALYACEQAASPAMEDEPREPR